MFTTDKFRLRLGAFCGDDSFQGSGGRESGQVTKIENELKKKTNKLRLVFITFIVVCISG